MKMSLSFKLILGFAVVAAITLIVGIIGFVSIQNTGARVHIFTEEALPVIRSIENLNSTQNAIEAAVRTLTSPYIDKEVYDRQFYLYRNKSSNAR